MNIKPSEKLLSILGQPFPDIKFINVGIVLISIYFIFDFGSIAGLYSVLNFKYRLPFLLAASFILYALYLFFTGKIDFKQNTTKAFFFLCLYIILYALISTKLPVVRSGIIKSFSFYFSFYVVFLYSVKNLTQFVILLDVLIVSVAFSSLHGIFQGGLVWANKYLTDENEMALLAAMLVPIAFILFNIARSKFRKISYLVCIFLYITVNLIAHSRGGGLCLGIAMISCFICVKKKIQAILLMIIAGALIINFAPQKFFDEMKTLEQGVEEGTAADRIYLWGIGFEMFSDNPVFGIGPLNYPYYFFSYEQGEKYDLNFRFRSTHSTPVQWIAELGIVGSLLLILLMICLFNNWYKITQLKSEKNGDFYENDNLMALKILSHCLLTSIIIFWIGSLFLSLMTYPFFWVLIPMSTSLKNHVIPIPSMENY